jgi:hypothetical protein
LTTVKVLMAMVWLLVGTAIGNGTSYPTNGLLAGSDVTVIPSRSSLRSLR